MAEKYLDLDFADGRYHFALNLPQIDELQRKCDAGILEIFGRVMAGGHQLRDGEIILNPAEGRARVLDLTETIRLGLIGGGYGTVNGERVEVKPHDAVRLVENYVHPRPLMEAWEIAFSILGACVIGYEPPAEAGNEAAAANETAPSEDPAGPAG